MDVEGQPEKKTLPADGTQLPIQGQPTRTVKAGDAVQIPAETPHARRSGAGLCNAASMTSSLPEFGDYQCPDFPYTKS
jgi:mannose-6-phosphate isomerase class I